MFSDFLKAKKIEIVVKKIDNLYQAACSIFPESIGVGSNEQEAIENLADLIIGRVDAVIKETLKDVLKETISRKVKTAKRVVIKNNSATLNKIGNTESHRSIKKDKLPGKFTFDLPLRTDLFKTQGLFSGRNSALSSKYGLVVLGLRSLSLENEDVPALDLMNVWGDADFPVMPGLFDMEKYKIPDYVQLGMLFSFN